MEVPFLNCSSLASGNMGSYELSRSPSGFGGLKDGPSDPGNAVGLRGYGLSSRKNGADCKDCCFGLSIRYFEILCVSIAMTNNHG
jgi:hypothetical protein